MLDRLDDEVILFKRKLLHVALRKLYILPHHPLQALLFVSICYFLLDLKPGIDGAISFLDHCMNRGVVRKPNFFKKAPLFWPNFLVLILVY